MQRLQSSAKAKGEYHEIVPNSMHHNFPRIVYGMGTPSYTCPFERIGLSSTVSKHTLCRAAELHTGAGKLYHRWPHWPRKNQPPTVHY